MVHPARSIVESLHAKGACPRIQVDLTREGVVCPDFVRQQWREELIIDLDPSYPLNLSFTAEGVEADLSFDGFVTRCTFPFHSIYIVADRDNGKGIVIEANMPESVRRKRKPAPKPPTAAERRAQGKPDQAAGESRRRRRSRPKPELAAAPEPATETAEFKPAVVADGPEAQAETRGTGDEEAKRRRSVFQVIDGDG